MILRLVAGLTAVDPLNAREIVDGEKPIFWEMSLILSDMMAMHVEEDAESTQIKQWKQYQISRFKSVCYWKYFAGSKILHAASLVALQLFHNENADFAKSW
jgi:hypothetical protein